ncbi:helix-turn-helix domain-containing protein [Microbispora bryophytorum]|uniref:helix-turn-helix domain-containing protein n=1 Tax=Microbispora bryophytorum TaxID=1460882 RepID=UPI0033CD551E
MLNGLYEKIAAQPNGLRDLASARLRRRALVLLHRALEMSGLNQSDLAKKLGVRRSAVNQVLRGDGNLRLETLAEYLHEMGFELDVNLVRAGEPRRAAQENRRVRLLNPSRPASSSVVRTLLIVPVADEPVLRLSIARPAVQPTVSSSSWRLNAGSKLGVSR